MLLPQRTPWLVLLAKPSQYHVTCVIMALAAALQGTSGVAQAEHPISILLISSERSCWVLTVPGNSNRGMGSYYSSL